MYCACSQCQSESVFLKVVSVGEMGEQFAGWMSKCNSGSSTQMSIGPTSAK